MKKHPIDDLFARKLGNNKIEPSAEAWKKLQSKLQPDDESMRLVIMPTWQTWAVAAGVSAVLVAGWLVLDRPSATTDRQLAGNVQKLQKQIASATPQKGVSKATQTSTMAALENENEPRNMAQNRVSVGQKSVFSVNIPTVQEGSKQELSLIETNKQVAEVPKQETKAAGEVTVILQIEDTEAVAKSEETSITQTPEATLSAEPIVVKKRTKLSRFLAKIRDLKSDEANEDALLARANPKANNLESKIDDLKQFNFNRKQPNN